MKKLIIFLFVFVIGLSGFAKQQKIGGLNEDQLKSMNYTADYLTKKMYSGAFLSPSDVSNLIGIKIKLDDAMLVSQETQYAQLYYKLGKIFQKRGNTNEAVECYQTIIENFSDTALAPMSAQKLKSMGINIKFQQKETEEE